MCGIGVVRRFDGTPVAVGDLRRMLATMRHRGPDDAGYALVDRSSLGLANVRLSVIDVAGGGQPIFHREGETCILLNGEIYDYQDERKELIGQGCEFNTATDSEVALQLYLRDGLSFLDLLNGEFALVLWDAARRRLLMARDRFGVKPLFYRVADNELLVASEAKALLALPRVPRAIAPEYLTSAFVGITDGSISAFEGIRALAPGHFVLADASGVHEERPFCELSFDVDRGMSFEDAGEEVRRLLLRAVRRRLVADCPVNAFLSGGLDSTLVLGCMVRHGHRPKAYHVSFPGSQYDESRAARSVAEHLGVEYHPVECTAERMAEVLVETVYHVEGVLVGLNACAKLILSRAARSDTTKVCLTGEGSDEIFAGYPSFRLEAIWRLGNRGSGAFSRRDLLHEFAASEALTRGVMWHDVDPDQTDATYGYPCLLQIRVDEISRKISRMLPAEIRKQIRNPSALLRQIFEPARYRGIDPVNAARGMALKYLAGHILPGLGDRPEMAGSIECRLPFLDRDLVDFACTIPPHYLVDPREAKAKRLLLDSCADLLPPPEVWRRHKQCFLAPAWRGLKRTRLGREILAQYLSRRAVVDAGLFHPGFVRALQAIWSLGLPYQAARLDQLLGAVLTMQILHALFVRQQVSVPSDFAMTRRFPRRGSVAPCAGE